MTEHYKGDDPLASYEMQQVEIARSSERGEVREVLKKAERSLKLGYLGEDWEQVSSEEAKNAPQLVVQCIDKSGGVMYAAFEKGVLAKADAKWTAQFGSELPTDKSESVGFFKYLASMPVGWSRAETDAALNVERCKSTLSQFRRQHGDQILKGANLIAQRAKKENKAEDFFDSEDISPAAADAEAMRLAQEYERLRGEVRKAQQEVVQQARLRRQTTWAQRAE